MARQREDEDPRRPAPVARDGPFVAMLFTALAALIAGCVLLYLDYDEYGKTQPPKEPDPKVQPRGEPAKIDSPPPPAPPAPGPAPGPEPAPGPAPAPMP